MFGRQARIIFKSTKCILNVWTFVPQSPCPGSTRHLSTKTGANGRLHRVHCGLPWAGKDMPISSLFAMPREELKYVLITSARNEESHIRATIESVVAQTQP